MLVLRILNRISGAKSRGTSRHDEIKVDKRDLLKFTPRKRSYAD